MKHFFALHKLMVTCFFVMLFFSRCMYVGAFIMSMEEKRTIAKWKSGNYKTRIQRRAGWAGPYCYYCRIKEKKLGGLYYRTIVNEQIVKGYRMNCIIEFAVHKTDSIAVDICNEKTTLIK
jgi:hypothetical protein